MGTFRSLALLPLSRAQPKERSGLLRGLSFLGMAVSLLALAWSTWEVTWPGLLLILTGVGHWVSWRWGERESWLRRLLMAGIVLGSFVAMQQGLFSIFTGGLLIPLGRFLALSQAVVSFGLRTRRSLYDGLALSLTLLLVVSEQGSSVSFAAFFLLFAVVGLLFLLASHHLNEGKGTAVVLSVGTARLVGLGAAAAAVALVVAVPVYILLPQKHVVPTAGPLPSRLDVTSGWPPPPVGTSPGDWTPWAKFLPSREEETPVDGSQETLSSPRGSGYQELGYTGASGDDVVMYVRSGLASFWRGFTLDTYDGHGWVSSGSGPRFLMDREGRLRFEEAPARTPQGDVYVQSYLLKVSQPAAVFTAYNPGWIAQGDTGARALDALRRASAYRVVSPVPTLLPQDLRRDRADRSDLSYLTLPPVPERVRRLAQDVVAGAATDYDRAARLERFLLTQYRYDLAVGPYPQDGDAVDTFLFQQQAGYCAQFATALAVMGRLAGLPTRVAVGYLPGRYNSLTGLHEVRWQDAHAWVEMKFVKNGWVAFDATPAPNSPWASGYGETAVTLGLQQRLRNVLGDMVLGAPSRLSATLSGAPWALLAAVLAVAGVGALWAILAAMVRRPLRRSKRLGVRSEPYSALDGDDREAVRRSYRAALDFLRRKGHAPRLPHQGPREYLVGVALADQETRENFRCLTDAAAEAAYNPGPLRRGLATQAARWAEALATHRRPGDGRQRPPPLA